MEHQSAKNLPSHLTTLLAACVVLGSVILYEMIQIKTLSLRVETLSDDLAITKQSLTENVQHLSKNYTELNKQTAGLSTTLTNTEWNINAVRSKVGSVEQSVGSISGTVDTLKKLSEVDPQLLKKYSKVYFLNENYTPAHLTAIPSQYLYSTGRQEQYLAESWPFLKKLLDEAQAQNVPLYIKSGYRSFAEQKALKSSYAITYGAGTANAFSADQGYSEHQLGSTIDIITTGLGGQLTASFDTTSSYKWLTANAYRYGFVLSYPKGNKYYVYEPWHWRFVGVKLATYLHTNNLNFYDMDQRQIDTYLVNTFD